MTLLWGPHYQELGHEPDEKTTWKERYNLQVRADAFNVFNHPNFGVPALRSAIRFIGAFRPLWAKRAPSEFAAKVQLLVILGV